MLIAEIARQREMWKTTPETLRQVGGASMRGEAEPLVEDRHNSAVEIFRQGKLELFRRKSPITTLMPGYDSTDARAPRMKFNVGLDSGGRIPGPREMNAFIRNPLHLLLARQTVSVDD